MERHMFVAIVRFPEVPTEREGDLRMWFAWSNGLLSGTDGLRGRRLLRAADGGYTAIIEHDSAETFAAMHTTDEAARVHAHLHEVLGAEPAATTYEVVVDLVKSGSCCGGGGQAGEGEHGGHDLAAVGVGADLQAAGGCCHEGRESVVLA